MIFRRTRDSSRLIKYEPELAGVTMFIYLFYVVPQRIADVKTGLFDFGANFRVFPAETWGCSLGAYKDIASVVMAPLSKSYIRCLNSVWPSFVVQDRCLLVVQNFVSKGVFLASELVLCFTSFEFMVP
jgi:hypothetical protein